MKKSKVTVIDVGIIVILLAVFVVGIKVLGSKIGSSGETKEVYFTVLATNVVEGTSKAVTEGEKVSVSFSEEAYATVLGASEEPHKESKLFESKGYYITHEVEGKSDVRITLKCDAAISDTKIANGNVAIRVGEEMPVCGKGYTIKGYIIEVEEK